MPSSSSVPDDMENYCIRRQWKYGNTRNKVGNPLLISICAVMIIRIYPTKIGNHRKKSCIQSQLFFISAVIPAVPPPSALVNAKEGS